MKPKVIIKLVIDVLMTLALLVLMGYQFWGEAGHKLAGVGMFVLFIAHHIVNVQWHKNLFKGKYTAGRILALCIDLLIFVAIFVEMYSGIVLSRYVFKGVPIDSGMMFAKRLHILGAYWGFLLMSIHLGLHWNMIIGAIRKSIHIKEDSKVRSVILFILGVLIAGYGVCVFIKRDFLTYLFLRSELVFMDYSEFKVLFYIDYLALMGLCIFIAHYGSKVHKYLNKKKCSNKE